VDHAKMRFLLGDKVIISKIGAIALVESVMEVGRNTISQDFTDVFWCRMSI